MTDYPNTPSDDDFDDLSDLDWLNSADVAPTDEEVDLFGSDKSENVYGDRDRDAGIGQAQYGRIVRRRMEDAIEKAEEAEFGGDPNQILDWMSEADVSEQGMPDWLRAPEEDPPAEWLQGVNFNAQSSTDWLKSVPSSPDVPLWSPPQGDTGGLDDKVPDALSKATSPRDEQRESNWLDRTRFASERPSTSELGTQEPEDRYALDAFGLAGVDPLRTGEVPATAGLLDDLLGDEPPIEEPPIQPAAATPDFDADMFGFAEFESFESGQDVQPISDDMFGAVDFATTDDTAWDDLMTAFPDYTPPETQTQAGPLDLSDDFFDLSPMEEAEPDDDFDVDELLAVDTRQPGSLSDQLGAASEQDFDLDAILNDIPTLPADDDEIDQIDLNDLFGDVDDEAISTLPRSDYEPASVATEGVEDESIPDWLRDANPFAEADRDWLSDFDEPAVSVDPLADLNLNDSPSASTIRTLSNLESRGDSPGWLSRLQSDEVSNVPTEEPTFGGRRYNLTSNDMDEMLAGGGSDQAFEELVQSLQTGTASEPASELDELLASMRAEHEMGDDQINSYRDMFDSNLFDKSSIAELEDEPRIARGNTGSLDDLFASGLFDTSEIATIDEDLPVRADLTDMFDEDREDLLADITFEDETYISDNDLPSWLQGAQEGLGNSALSAALRTQRDRPLAELDERMLALRDDVLSVKADSDTASGLITEILPGVPEVLTAAPITHATTELSTSLNVTDAQLAQAGLIEAILRDDNVARTGTQSTRVRLPILRLFVVVLLAAAVILPMAIDVNVAPAPLAAFAGAREAAFVDTINGLERGDLVLMGVEYDATNAYELDALTEATLTHLRLRGARPVIISSNSVGILRIEPILERVFPGGANSEYFITRLIASGAIGLRDLGGNTTLFNVDARGAANGLAITSLNDFAAGVLISSSLESNRLYVEQVIPAMPRPFLLASTFAALPPSMAYYTAGLFDGVLAGYRDTVIYNAVLGIAEQSLLATPIPPTEEPTATPVPATATPTPRPPTRTPIPTADTTGLAPLLPADLTQTAEVTAEPTSSAITAPTQVPASATPTTVILPATSTTVPTRVLPQATPITPAPTTPTPQPTLPAGAVLTSTATTRPTSTATFTATPDESLLVLVGTIIATDTINVRQNPSSGTTPVIGSLQPGAVVRVLNFNEDRTWVSVVLPGDRIGWVAAFLIRVEERPASEVSFPRLPATYRLQQATPEALIQIGTAILNTPVNILGAPATDAPVIGVMARGDQLRVLVVEGEYASVVLPDNRIGFVETFALDIRARQASDSAELPAPGLTVVPATATVRPTRTPSPTATPTLTPTPIAPTVAAAAPPDQPRTEGGPRWQSQFFGVLAAIGIILLGNLFYLIRAILNGRRRPA